MLKKMFVLLFITFFVSGCSVEYNLNISENIIEDNMIIKYTENDLINQPDDEELMGNRLKALIDYDVYPLFEDYSVKYNKISEENGLNNNLILSYNYSYSDFKNSNIINTCFKNRSVNCNEEKCNINLNGYFYCLYNNNEIIVNIKTDYRVLEENANLVNDNIYTWKIDRNNYRDVDIKLSLDATKESNVINNIINRVNEYEDEEVSNFFVYIYIILGIVLFLGLVFVLVKVKNSNKK